MDVKKFGYLRVSTKEQNENRQIEALASYNISNENMFMDKQSGKDFDRPEYNRMLRKLCPGDLIIVKSIDRLGRNYEDIIKQWKIITRDKGADILIIDMPILDTRKDKDLIGTLISDLVLQILSFVSENEREEIRKRQKEGIAAAKIRGVRFGRPSLIPPKNFYEVNRKWKKGELSSRQAANILRVSQTTFLSWSKRNSI